jgi:hypothetical protein
MGKGRFLAITIFVSSFILAGCLQYLAPDAKTPRMTKKELKSLLGNPDVMVVDVRIEDHWKESKWKIQGAVRENPEKDLNTWVDKYPKDKTLVFY